MSSNALTKSVLFSITLSCEAKAVREDDDSLLQDITSFWMIGRASSLCRLTSLHILAGSLIGDYVPYSRRLTLSPSLTFSFSKKQGVLITYHVSLIVVQWTKTRPSAKRALIILGCTQLKHCPFFSLSFSFNTILCVVRIFYVQKSIRNGKLVLCWPYAADSQ